MSKEQSAQAALPTCTNHPQGLLNTYCKTCDLRICEGCQNDHKNHNLMQVSNLAREVRQDASSRCHVITQLIEKMKKKKIELSGQIKDIRRMQTERVSMINEYADSLVSLVSHDINESEISGEIRKLESMLDFFQNQLDIADENVIMENEEEFHIKQKKLCSPTQEMKFIEGNKLSEHLHNLFGKVIQTRMSYKGDIPKVKVKEQSKFTYIDDSNFLFGIYPVSSTEARLNRYYEAKLDKVDSTGTVTQKINLTFGTRIDYCIILDNGDIVYTLFLNKVIRRLSASGTESDICSTQPLHPTGICKSENGGMLVCLAECPHTHMTSTSRGEIHHLDTSGRILQIFNFTGETKQHLFKHPQRISENVNMDICVLDFTDDKGLSRLVVVSPTSCVRFTYDGQPNLKEKFRSYDVCCDKVGRILLPDLLNHAVHLLREDGHFLQYVLTEQSPLFGPSCIGVYENTMWVGCYEGVVRVYKYLDEE